jgi:hypothetical protein
MEHIPSASNRVEGNLLILAQRYGSKEGTIKV